MNKQLTVIISTYNPDVRTLQEVLLYLSKQTYPLKNWELLIIDNNSTNNFTEQIDLTWHPAYRLIRESKQGLTFARLRGFTEGSGNLLVMVDDDNFLDKDYLTISAEVFAANAHIGAIGGKCMPQFQIDPPDWVKPFYGNLALRDLGDEIILDEWTNHYPATAPIGAGMVIRKEALSNYCRRVLTDENPVTDRTGGSLSSGGDNEIIIEILKSGWKTGYFPSLIVHHFIPKERLDIRYFSRLVYEMNRSWIAVLETHQINPWSSIAGWSVSLRKWKSWVRTKAWASKANHLRWLAVCGMLDGLAEIRKKKITKCSS